MDPAFESTTCPDCGFESYPNAQVHLTTCSYIQQPQAITIYIDGISGMSFESKDEYTKFLEYRYKNFFDLYQNTRARLKDAHLRLHKMGKTLAKTRKRKAHLHRELKRERETAACEAKVAHLKRLEDPSQAQQLYNALERYHVRCVGGLNGHNWFCDICCEWGTIGELKHGERYGKPCPLAIEPRS